MNYGGVLFVGGVLFGLMCVTFCIIVIMRERRYDRKMIAGEVPYRLPLNLRLTGWSIAEYVGDVCARGLIWDTRIKQYVAITRLSSEGLKRAFPA